MRLTKGAMFALIGGVLAMPVTPSTWAAECAANDERIDYADATLCIPKANDLYRHTFDEYGLQFVQQTFIGDRGVPSELYYDADGNAPVEGTYVTVSIRPPSVGQFDVQRYERMKRKLNEAIAAHPGESTFEDERRLANLQFRRLDASTIVAMQIFAEYDVQVSEIWLSLDNTGKIQHTLSCEHWPERKTPIECQSWIRVGTSIAIVRFSGGKQERSFRLSRQIRADLEGFLVKGDSP